MKTTKFIFIFALLMILIPSPSKAQSTTPTRNASDILKAHNGDYPGIISLDVWGTVWLEVTWRINDAGLEAE